MFALLGGLGLASAFDVVVYGATPAGTSLIYTCYRGHRDPNSTERRT